MYTYTYNIYTYAPSEAEVLQRTARADLRVLKQRRSGHSEGSRPQSRRLVTQGQPTLVRYSQFPY